MDPAGARGQVYGWRILTLDAAWSFPTLSPFCGLWNSFGTCTTVPSRQGDLADFLAFGGMLSQRGCVYCSEVPEKL